MKISYIGVVGLIIAFGINSDVYCQKSPKRTTSDVRIEANLPTVFIELVHVDDNRKDSDDRRVWFRIRNNSKWLIKLDASGGSTDDSVTLYYETLDTKGNIKDSHFCHVCSVVGLESGKSLLFSVPYDVINDAKSLRVRFNYFWEDRVAVAPAQEPTHYVFFYNDEEQISP